jgi:hypothetical protein
MIWQVRGGKDLMLRISCRGGPELAVFSPQDERCSLH